jgi:predicted 3-demethylubiquinone-9 3-methyltransferase (glyoxalase superfamily)
MRSGCRESAAGFDLLTKGGETPRRQPKGASDADNYAVSVVRLASRRRHELLYLDFQALDGRRRQSVQFELEGQKFMALNAGPAFKFTEAISFFVGCETQQEVDELWEKLLAGGGSPSRCGWLKDKFGLSWQIVPNALPRMLNDKDPAKATRVMNAMLQMNKLEVARLQQAYDGA